jgi:hypothetical protein
MEEVVGSSPTIRSKIMKQPRQRIVKFTATVEIERHDWGWQATHAAFGLVATDKTETGALQKLDGLIAKTLEFGLAHGNLKLVKSAQAGK